MRADKFRYKVVSFVERDELDFLDNIAKDIYFTTGKKIARSEIIKEIIRICEHAGSLKEEIIKDIKHEE
ncbi:MAG: hypothetical protein JW734_06865 [Candidatus Omnitrophica bacterium]|nr:hypothetical protein [Candidatus Omnitrophota bacterium]